ncbi:CYTH domain-containing protein [Antarcticirhabdus aurantiaca]|uniref:CYTH domain-containing protein n=1 Tax=Antarcticirhabdus aurantiaca TaxID=2606717 RepID=A0ACD4NUF7_9HYPH|nr:CYTH domain-containing protein [Antarcticirhabdus aurantiaca]WAJ30473.1 CYTH domain-containing protein [Jeongeuplla avenae]
MGIEIERKFRIVDDQWRQKVEDDDGRRIRQFYLAVRDGFSLRVRILDEARAVMTLKTGAGLSRGEYEYEIPLDEARELEASRIGRTVEKRRYRVDLGADGLVVEVDVFEGALAPLVLAEIELPAVDHAVELPDWLGPEVTGEGAYSNSSLALAEAPPLPQQS